MTSTHVKSPPTTPPPPSMVYATNAAESSFRMLLVVPVIDEFRIVGVELLPLYTPTLSVPPVAEAVTSVIDGDDDAALNTPMLITTPPLAVAVTFIIDGDDELLYTP